MSDVVQQAQDWLDIGREDDLAVMDMVRGLLAALEVAEAERGERNALRGQAERVEKVRGIADYAAQYGLTEHAKYFGKLYLDNLDEALRGDA